MGQGSNPLCPALIRSRCRSLARPEAETWRLQRKEQDVAHMPGIMGSKVVKGDNISTSNTICVCICFFNQHKWVCIVISEYVSKLGVLFWFQKVYFKRKKGHLILRPGLPLWKTINIHICIYIIYIIIYIYISVGKINLKQTQGTGRPFLKSFATFFPKFGGYAPEDFNLFPPVTCVEPSALFALLYMPHEVDCKARICSFDILATKSPNDGLSRRSNFEH